MKLQRFYVAEQLRDRTMPIRIPSLELTNQLKHVLRLSPGDKVTLFDGSGVDFSATIDNYDKDEVSFNILEKHDNTVEARRETHLFASIVKKDNFEWIVEKATELGVSDIVPIISARTEKKDINRERLNKIIIEASEQSGRSTLPTLHEVIDLKDALSKYSQIKSIVWDPSTPKFSELDLADIAGSYVGPEGGWTNEELYMFKKSGVKSLSLGPQILRAETAVIATLSRLVF